MPSIYQIKQEVVNKIMRISGDDVISGYITGYKDDHSIIIDAVVLEKYKVHVHVKPQKWVNIIKGRIRTLRQMKDDRQTAKEQEIEQQYIIDHQQQIIDEFIIQNRAVINAKNHVKELAKDFAKNKGMNMRIVYHFHTHPDKTTELTDVDQLFLNHMQNGIEVIVTPSVVIGYQFERGEVRSRLQITQIPFTIIQ